MNNKLALLSFISLFILFFVVLTSGMKKQEDAGSHADYVSGPFETPQDVTRACLDCHDDAAEDFIKTRHWNWLGDEFEIEGKGKIQLGKRNLINNFCIAVSSNEPRCTSCHPGYGWKDDTFDFTNKENIDCLVCHDQTNTYKKTPTAAGMPDPSVDLEKVAQNVGKPRAENCGQCHFNGGGGEAVKHGDLDPTLLKREREVDVHMGGLGFECIDCHTTENHKISGASHGSMAAGTNHIGCVGCHNPSESKVHSKPIIERHLDALACESCHVPVIGRNMATKTYWDWSTAGERENEKDENGTYTYSKLKGDFLWEKNVVPEYEWYNGKAEYYLAGDKFDPNSTLYLNKLHGDISDANSKITPFKKMMGKQPYDTENNYLIIPQLFGKDGFWTTFDWVEASKIGMGEVGLDFSGEVGFIETAMYWTQNHAVAPKEDALKCNDCHNSGKRLDWKALGYKGDPMRSGGRAKNK